MKCKNYLALTSIVILILAVFLYKWPSKTSNQPQPTPQKLEYSREVLPNNPIKYDENNVTDMDSITSSASGIILPKDLQEEKIKGNSNLLETELPSIVNE